MTLEELLSHNYPIVKNGDWVGFRVSYILQSDGWITDWWEIVRTDPYNKGGFICTHSHEAGEGVGLFDRDNIRQYWERQLMWFYEKAMKNAENR